MPPFFFQANRATISHCKSIRNALLEILPD